MFGEFFGMAWQCSFPDTTNITRVASYPHFLQFLFKLSDFKLRHALLTLLKLLEEIRLAKCFKNLGWVRGGVLDDLHDPAEPNHHVLRIPGWFLAKQFPQGFPNLHEM